MDSDLSSNSKTLRSIAVASLLALTFIVTFVKLWDSDTFWHLKAGQLISSEKRLPPTDDFSFTKNGEEWINDEWMGDYFLYSKYEKYGLTGLQVTVSIIAMITIWVAYVVCVINGADPFVTVLFLIVTVMGARTRMTARPEILSLLLMMGVFFMLNRVILKNTNDSSSASAKINNLDLLLIPVIQIIWSNTHPGSVFSLVIIFTALLGTIAVLFFNPFNIENAPYYVKTTSSKLILIFLACFLASAFNPYGLHAISAPFKFAESRVYLQRIAEWAPIPFSDMFSLSGPPGHLALPFFTISGVITFTILRKRTNPFHLLIFIISAAMAIKSRRFIAIFLLLSVPYLTVGFSFLFKNALNKMLVKALLTLTILCSCVLCGLYLGVKDPALPWGRGISKSAYPINAINFLKKNHIRGNMYNTYALGGPIIWGLYPEYKVFSDGRVPLYGPDFYSMIVLFESDPTPEKWNKLQLNFNLSFAVLKRERTAVANAILHSTGDWKLIFWDDYSMILGKNIPENSELIKKHSYKMISPTNALNFAKDWNKLSDSEKNSLLSELNENLSQAPDSFQSILSLVFIHFKMENYEEAKNLALKGLEISEDQARLHAVLGEVYLKEGNVSKSKYHIKRAEEISEKHGLK